LRYRDEPNAAVYALVEPSLGMAKHESFDAIGAKHSGFNVAWIERGGGEAAPANSNVSPFEDSGGGQSDRPPRARQAAEAEPEPERPDDEAVGSAVNAAKRFGFAVTTALSRSFTRRVRSTRVGAGELLPAPNTRRIVMFRPTEALLQLRVGGCVRSLKSQG
jgi:hypothetical protein